MKKRLLSVLLAVCMVTAILPTFGGTAFAADAVTRSEWISRLVETFSMTVESDDNMPDNYFSDISEDDSYYRDILLAVEFGVIDLEAGEAFEPDADATREFAAQTLNSCLMFQLDEGAEYTYSEADSVTYPDDIQVAVNRGWFALSGKNFLPEQAVTASEADAMIADAKEIIAGDVIDENHENTYEFAKGVIEIPKTANAVIDADNTVTITDYDAQISEGDIFVVYSNGFPIVLKALSIEAVDNTTVITSTKEGTENALISMESEDCVDIDIENFVPNEVSTYSIINTSTPTAENEDLVFELASISYNKGKLTATQKISVGSAAAGSVTFEIQNLKLKHKANLLSQEAEVSIVGDATITTSIDFDFGEYAGIPSSITLGYINILGIGSISLSAEYSLKGGMSMTWTGDIEAGFSYNKGDFRLIKSFDKKDSTFTAEAEISAGLRLLAEVDIIVAKGAIYATVGARMNAKISAYDSGTPKTCATFKGYIYATIGADASVFGQNLPSKSQNIYDETNSPVRVVYHYEDGVQVTSCSRGESLKYSTSPSSRYFNPSPSYGQGSYGSGGTGGTATPVVIWEYSTDNNGNATITKYRGNASAVVIPEKIDGHTVTKIGESAFDGNKIIRAVSMSNSVTIIDNYAFKNCTNLSSVSLSKKLKDLGFYAFGGCVALTEIEIPKTLERTYSNITSSRDRGSFNNSGLTTVTFEDGSTLVADNLFNEAHNLKNVVLTDSMLKIGSRAFSNCISLESINIPDTITVIDNYAFMDCTKLNNVTLSKGLTDLGFYSFGGCTALTEIEIPKTLIRVYNNISTSGDGGAFNNSGLTTVTFEEGTTQIANHLFREAYNLKNVTLLDTITAIGERAFAKCTSLNNISIPNSVVTIGREAFGNCTAIKSIKIPDSVTVIDNYAFRDCTNLSDVTLSKNLTDLGFYSFGGCTALTEIEIPKTLIRVYNNISTSGDGGAFNNSGLTTVTFEEGTTQIANHLFREAHNLKNVALLDTITKIGNKAFYQCTSLNDINIPNSVIEINDDAFMDCISLKKIVIPNSVNYLGSSVFSGCAELNSASLPITIKNIPASLFYGCKKLTNIEVPSFVIDIENSAFYGCSSLKNIEFPKGLNNIGNTAFGECSSLEKINIDSLTLQHIGNSAFYNCDNMTNVTLNLNGQIESKAFYDCDALTTIDFGEGVTSIGNEICYGCDNLTDVQFGKYITKIPDSAFRQCQSLETITLPRFCTTVAANAFAENTKLASVYMPVSVSKIENNSFSYPMKMTMYGKSGSYAEEYADSRNMAFNAVNEPITSIKYADSSMSIARNATVRPQLNIDPAFDTSVVTFSTSDNKILTVSDTGLVRGVNYGTATITATADSGKSTSIEITVLKTATKLELDKTSLSLEQGQSDTLSVTMTPYDAADKLSWSSSNPAVAAVDENGKVTGVGIGTSIITVAAVYGGVNANCTVEVVGDVTITASAGEHGKITPSGEVSVKSNAKTTFAIIPDYGYVVKDVQVNGASVGVIESYTFSNPKENATIHADFAAVNVSYENGDVVITSEAKLDNLKLIIAEYNDDNSLSDCKIETVTAEPNVEHHVLVSPTSKYKLMLWSSMDTMRPIWSR